MKSKLLITLLTSVLATPVYAQFLGGSAGDEEDLTAKALGQTPAPEGRTPDRATKPPPQQVDFSAPEQIDFGVDAALPEGPAEPGNRTPARRTPATMDRAVDRLADEAVDSGFGAGNTPKNEADRSLSLRH